MNPITRKWFGLFAGCALAGCLASQSFAIEGLKIAIQSTNVVLSWPSASSETYMIQCRHTLSVTDSWMTLADYYPPSHSGTNITYFLIQMLITAQEFLAVVLAVVVFQLFHL